MEDKPQKAMNLLTTTGPTIPVNEPAPTPPQPTPELLVADTPQGLAAAQVAMIFEMDGKIMKARNEVEDATAMVAQMKSVGMSHGAADRLRLRAEERVGFLIKVKAALEAGYVMMPDMPGEVLAVRTAKEKPSASTWRRAGSEGMEEKPDTRLPPGEGRYVAPEPTYDARETTGGHWEERAVRLRDPAGLDHKFLKPEVVERMTRAMSKGIFDEVVCVGARTESNRGRSSVAVTADKDPIVLGRIVSKRQVASFLIAWFMDMRDV